MLFSSLIFNSRLKLSYIPELIERKINGTEKGILPEANLEFYQKESERLTIKLEKAKEKTHLPEKATGKDDLNDLLVHLRLSEFV